MTARGSGNSALTPGGQPTFLVIVTVLYCLRSFGPHPSTDPIMISKRSTFIASVLVLAAITAGGTYYASSKAGGGAGAVQQSLPPPFNALQVGSTQQDVLAQVGKPESQSANRLFENKTAKDWSEIEAQVDKLGQRSQDAYSTISTADHTKFLSLSRMLAHRTKSVWTYPKAAGSTDKVVLAFDGDGKLLRVDVKYKPHLGGGPPPAQHH